MKNALSCKKGFIKGMSQVIIKAHSTTGPMGLKSKASIICKWALATKERVIPQPGHTLPVTNLKAHKRGKPRSVSAFGTGAGITKAAKMIHPTTL